MTGNIRILGRHLVSRGHGTLERLAVERKCFDGRVHSLARGREDEGEVLEILEPTLDQAPPAIGNGENINAKAILLLH